MSWARREVGRRLRPSLRGGDDRGQRLRIEAGAANQRAVHVRECEQLSRVVGLDAPAVEDPGQLCLLGGAIASQLIRSMLYGVRPLDVTIFVAVAIVLTLVAAASCLMPAWQASRLDPIRALRVE